MTARENSRAQYITSASDITQVFNDELQRMHSIFAQRITLNVALRPGGVLRSVSRVRPFIATIPMVEEADQRWNGSLGDWPGSDSHAFLLEIVVPALEVGDQPLLKLALKYDLPGAGLRDQVAEEIVRVTVRPADQVGYEVEPAVKHWLERLVAYRLQSSAWQDLEAGRIEEANQTPTDGWHTVVRGGRTRTGKNRAGRGDAAAAQRCHQRRRPQTHSLRHSRPDRAQRRRNARVTR